MTPFDQTALYVIASIALMVSHLCVPCAWLSVYVMPGVLWPPPSLVVRSAVWRRIGLAFLHLYMMGTTVWLFSLGVSGGYLLLRLDGIPAEKHHVLVACFMTVSVCVGGLLLSLMRPQDRSHQIERLLNRWVMQGL